MGMIWQHNEICESPGMFRSAITGVRETISMEGLRLESWGPRLAGRPHRVKHPWWMILDHCGPEKEPDGRGSVYVARDDSGLRQDPRLPPWAHFGPTGMSSSLITL